MIQTMLFVSVLPLLVLLAPSAAADPPVWPQFRGSAGTGLSDDRRLPLEFGPNKNVIWKTEVPPGHSSPVIWRDRIFLTAVDGENLFTLCLDRGSGKILWRRQAPRDRVEHFQKTNGPASPSPVTDGRSVFVFFGDFGMLAYGFDGEERWRLPLGPFNNANGHGSSPIVFNDKIFLLCDQDTDSFLIAVDKASGKVRWRAERPEVTRGYATPGIFHPKQGPPELIVPGAYVTIAYSPETGEKLWWVRGMAWQLKAVPLFRDNVIYINAWEIGGDFEQPPQQPTFKELLAKHDADGDGRLSPAEAHEPRYQKGWGESDFDRDGYLGERDWTFHCARRGAQNNLVAIRHGGRGDLTDTNVLWRYRKSLPNTPSPLLYKDVIFLIKDGGIVTTLHPDTGEVLKQGRIPEMAERIWSSPVGADGKVYMSSEGGKVAVLSAKGDWEVLQMNELDDTLFATPAIVESRLYIRTGRALYCFGN